MNVTRTYLPSLEQYSEYLKKIWNSGWVTNYGPLIQELESIEALLKVSANYTKYNRENIRNYALQRFGPSTFLSHMEQLYNADYTGNINKHKEAEILPEPEKSVLDPVKP